MMPEPDLTSPSVGVVKARLGEHVVVWDVAGATAHILGPLGSYLMSLDKPVLIGDLVDEVAAATAGARDEVEAEVHEAVRLLRAQRLLDHSQSWERVPPWPGSTSPAAGRLTGATHSVVDYRIAFRSSSKALLGEIDEFLGGGQSIEPNTLLDADLGPDGGVTLTAADIWPFRDRAGFFRQLVDILNEYAARGNSSVALHAGAVRTPDGRIVLLAGEADTGKSTLTAALVQAGCDYLGDDVIGIRTGNLSAIGYPKPLCLDRSSRQVLGVPDSSNPHVLPRELRSDAELLTEGRGAISEIVLPVYRFDQGSVTTTRFDSVRAIKALLAHTLNLGRVGQNGLQTLCRLADEVSVTRIEHDGAVAAAAEIIAGPRTSPLGVTVRGYNAIDAFQPLRTSEPSVEIVACAGQQVLLLRPQDGPTLLLDPLGSALWPLLDGTNSVAALVDRLASQFTHGGSLWHLIVEQLRAMVEFELIEAPCVSWPVSGTRPQPVGPWQDSNAWILAANLRRRSPRNTGDWQRPWTSPTSVTCWWGRVFVATDSERVCEAFGPALEIGAAVEVPVAGWDPLNAREQLIEVREPSGPRAGAAIRVGTQHLSWVPSGDVVEVLAIILSGMSDGPDLHTSAPIAPAWILASRREAALFVGEIPNEYGQGPGGTRGMRWSRRSGLRVERGRFVWVPDQTQVVAWLSRGADPSATTGCWKRHDLTALGVAEVKSTLDGWVAAADALAPWDVPSASYLGHLVDGGNVPIVVGSAHEVARQVSTSLGGPPDLVASASPDATGSIKSSLRGSNESADLERQLSRLGFVSVGDQSAKVDHRRIVTGRALLRVELDAEDALESRSPSAVQDLMDVFASFGLDHESAADAATIAARVGEFYVGEERASPDNWRRKIYVNHPPFDAWRSLSPRWPLELASHMNPGPSWLAWKFSSHSSGRVERAIDVPRLGGVPTIAEATVPELARMPEPWAEVVRAILDRLVVREEDRPRRGDTITVEEGGRSSIDIEPQRKTGTRRTRARTPLACSDCRARPGCGGRSD